MMKKNYDSKLSRFHLIPERDGQTDRQTDRIAISISRVSMLTRDKNGSLTVICPRASPGSPICTTVEYCVGLLFFFSVEGKQ